MEKEAQFELTGGCSLVCACKTLFSRRGAFVLLRSRRSCREIISVVGVGAVRESTRTGAVGKQLIIDEERRENCVIGRAQL